MDIVKTVIIFSTYKSRVVIFWYMNSLCLLFPAYLLWFHILSKNSTQINLISSFYARFAVAILSIEFSTIGSFEMWLTYVSVSFLIFNFTKKCIAEFPNSVPVMVNVNVNINLESQPCAPTKMGGCRWLSYYVHVYWEDF